MEAAIVLFFAHVLWVRVNRWWAVFLVCALASSMFPFYTRFSFMAFHAVLFAALWFTLLVLFIDRDQTSVLMDAMCIIAIFQVAYMCLQALGLDPLFKPAAGMTERPVTGLMANRNEVSALLAFCFPAFLRGRWKWGLLAILLGLCLARTAAGLVSAAAGWAFFQCLRGRLYSGLAAAAGGVLLYVLLIDGFGTERLEVWRRGLLLYKQHWLLGSGIGHWKAVAPVIDGNRWTYAHNEYLQGLFEMGIPFAVIVFGYLCRVAVRTWRIFSAAGRDARPTNTMIAATALVVVAANAGINFPFHVATTAMVAVTWMALFEIESRCV